MLPEAREVAKLSNEVLSVGRRLRNLARKLDAQNRYQQKVLQDGIEQIKQAKSFAELINEND